MHVRIVDKGSSMPIGPAHKRQRSKNLFLLGVLLLFVAGLFYLTILKISGA